MKHYLLFLLICLPIPHSGYAQNNSTLTVDETIQRVIDTYPSVREAEEAISAAGYQIRMAEAAFYPIVNAATSYRYLDPNEIMTFENNRIPVNPKSNYNVNLSVNQLIYDFGKNRPKIEAAKLKEEVSRIQQNEIFQALALNAVQLYYMNCFARQAILIKIQEMGDYEEMLRQVEVRTQSGSSTDFDLLNTKVGKSAVKTQMTGLTANLRSLEVQLSVLADTLITEAVPLDDQFMLQRQVLSLDDLLETAYASRPEAQIAGKQVAIAEQEESAARRSFNPSLDFAGSLGGRNGYPNYLDRMKFNYEVGVQLSVPLYQGGRRKQTNALARSAYNTALYRREVIVKQLTQEVSENYYTLISDLDKTEQLAFQVELAEQAYEQAKVNYSAGSITNLELLTSSTNLSASKLQLLQARINYIVNFYKLRVSIGEQIW